jgi:hypothetical protein
MQEVKMYAIVGAILAVILGVIFALTDGLEAATVNSNKHTTTFVVLSTEIKRIGVGDAASDLYLVTIHYIHGNSIHPDEGDIQTVQVKDNMWLGNWRSADLYFALKNSAGSGEVWQGDIGGVRNGWLSWFPHIVSVERTGQYVKE